MTRVCRLLEQVYGRPRFGNPRNAVDDLVYIILSNKTRPNAAKTVYRRLKERFPNWNDMATAPIRNIVTILRPAGLAQVKSLQLRNSLRQIAADFGRCSLASLRLRTVEEAELYLCSLPGVSEKVAKCVMMYTLGFEVLPVDAHVHRVVTRLGWTCRKRADQCHDELESLVPPKYRYAFHVDCLAHGRAVCRPEAPRCNECVIRSYCQYYNQQK